MTGKSSLLTGPALAGLLLAAFGLSACFHEAPPAASTAAAKVLATLVVHKSPYSGCCGL